jgi:hypothetical protein
MAGDPCGAIIQRKPSCSVGTAFFFWIRQRQCDHQQIKKKKKKTNKSTFIVANVNITMETNRLEIAVSRLLDTCFVFCKFLWWPQILS